MRGGIYFDERQIKKRRRLLKIKIFIGAVVFFALVAAAGYLAACSQVFKIKSIDVEINPENSRIDKDALIRDLRDFFSGQSEISSFLGPDNILIWNDDLSGFGKSPEIAGLEIEKDYSGRRIRITVSQREKFGVWCMTRINADQTQTNAENSPSISVSSPYESVCWWFDKNGVILGEAPQAEGNLIDRVDDFSGRTLASGNSVLDEKLSPNLEKIFAFMEKSGVGGKSLELKNPELQEIETYSSPKIYFSLRFSPDFGLAAVESLKSIGLDKVDYIDLRVENRAYYKLK